MVIAVKQFFTLPDLVDDKENRRVELIKLTLSIIVAGTILYAICLPFITSELPLHLGVLISIFCFIATTYQLIHKGRFHWAALLLIAWIWLFTTLFILADADDAVSFNPYVICIFLAGLLLGQRWGLACAGLSILISLTILWANVEHLLPTNWWTHTPMVSSVAQLIAFGMAAALLHFTAKHLTTAFVRAAHNEQALKEANRKLLARTREVEQHAAALQISEARAQALIQALPDTILRIQRSGYFLCAKTQPELIFSELASQAPTQRVEIYFPPTLAPQLLQAGFAQTRDEAGKVFEYTRVTMGERRIYEARVARVDAQEMLVIEREITERKQAGEWLQQSEERYRKLVELSPDGIFIVQEGKINYSNPAGLRLLGATEAAQIVNRPPILFVPADDRTRKIERGERLTTEGATLPFAERAVSRLDGTLFEAEIAAVAFRNQDGIAKQFIIRDITERKQAEAKNAQLLTALNAQSTQLRALNHRLAETQEAERKRLAQELHDQVGQNLTALDLNLNFIRTCLPVASPKQERAQASLIDSLAIVQQTNELVRDVLADLRPSILDNHGLCIALKWYATMMAKRAGLQIHVTCEVAFPRMAEAIELALFRIAQEAFNNIIKHAEASEVSVYLTVDATTVQMMISDNGRGFDPDALPSVTGRPSWGLLTMQERADAIGGSCCIESRPGHGTHIIVELTGVFAVKSMETNMESHNEH
ncbi:MAG: PAS domain S-box protein [Caldilineaceae bacterium]